MRQVSIVGALTLSAALALVGCTKSGKPSLAQPEAGTPTSSFAPGIVFESAITNPATIRIVAPAGDAFTTRGRGPVLADPIRLADTRQEQTSKGRGQAVMTGWHHEVDPAAKTITTDYYFSLAPSINATYEQDLSRSYVRYVAKYDVSRSGKSLVVVITPVKRIDYAGDAATAQFLPNEYSPYGFYIARLFDRTLVYSREYQLRSTPDEVFSGLLRATGGQGGQRSASNIIRGDLRTGIPPANVTMGVEVHPHRGGSLVRMQVEVKAGQPMSGPTQDLNHVVREINALVQRAG